MSSQADAIYNEGGYYGDQSTSAKLKRIREGYAQGKITLEELEYLTDRAIYVEQPEVPIINRAKWNKELTRDVICMVLFVGVVTFFCALPFILVILFGAP